MNVEEEEGVCTSRRRKRFLEFLSRDRETRTEGNGIKSLNEMKDLISELPTMHNLLVLALTASPPSYNFVIGQRFRDRMKPSIMGWEALYQFRMRLSEHCY